MITFNMWTFNVNIEFLCLFVHGFKTGESRLNLNVRNLSLKNGPWVAIYCKDEHPEGPTRKEHEREMERVVQCLQGKHGLTSLEACKWALTPPSGFRKRNFWAIARLGWSLDTTLVTEQTLENLRAAEAREL